MGVTRRYWGEAGLVAVLTGLAVLFKQPVVLLGAAGVGGWVLARQYVFVRTITDVANELSVSQSLERDTVAVEDDVTVRATVTLRRPAPVALEVSPDLPPGIKTTGDERCPEVVVSVGEEESSATFTVCCPRAGTFEFGSATVTATDETERFQTTFSVALGQTLTVEAPGPRNLHVGAGGEAITVPYGQHDSDKPGPGIDLAEIRSYVPGDTIRQIDWNATARLDEPHVRKFETDTERQMAVFLDRRPSMGMGPDGETKFDYARQVALAIISHARERGEPVSVYEVGEKGLLAHQRPTATEEGYVQLERRLQSLNPQDGGSGREIAQTHDGLDRARGERERSVRSPAVARQRTHRLRDDDSAFADRLRPFFADADPYVERVADDTLYGVARFHLERLSGAVMAVILTDDVHRTETREAMKVARRHDDHVLAFLTPTVLFERDAHTDLEAAYEKYVDFEYFRRELASLDGVSGFEVGPGDRLDTVLTAKESQHRAKGRT